MVHSKQNCNAETIPSICPKCGDDIFYYHCDCGTRIFFDELGYPWHKHPCFDYETGVIPGPRPKPTVYFKKQHRASKKLDPSNKQKIKGKIYDKVFIYTSESKTVSGEIINLQVATMKTMNLAKFIEESELENYLNYFQRENYIHITLKLQNKKQEKLALIYRAGQDKYPIRGSQINLRLRRAKFPDGTKFWYYEKGK